MEVNCPGTAFHLGLKPAVEKWPIHPTGHSLICHIHQELSVASTPLRGVELLLMLYAGLVADCLPRGFRPC